MLSVMLTIQQFPLSIEIHVLLDILRVKLTCPNARRQYKTISRKRFGFRKTKDD